MVAIDCAALRTRLDGRLPTPAIESACLLPQALDGYTSALTAVADGRFSDFDALEQHLRTGAILDGRRTRKEAAQAATRYFLAKAFLVSALKATAALYAAWYRVGSDDFFSYIFPQVNSALARGTKISSVLAFLSNVGCNERPCGDPRLASALAAVVDPVAMVRISDSAAITGSGFLARSTLEPYAIVLELQEALDHLRKAAADPDVVAEFMRAGTSQDAALRTLAAATASLEQQFEAAACWVSTPERQEALVWVDAKAAESVATVQTSRPRRASNSPGQFLLAAGDEARGASIKISDRLIRLRAMLSTVESTQ